MGGPECCWIRWNSGGFEAMVVGKEDSEPSQGESMTEFTVTPLWPLRNPTGGVIHIVEMLEMVVGRIRTFESMTADLRSAPLAARNYHGVFLLACRPSGSGAHHQMTAPL